MDNEALTLLRSIDSGIKILLSRSTSGGGNFAETADDRDLDGKYGNPELRFTPRGWNGDSHKGRKFSECPAELLDLAADSLDYFAKKADEAGELTSGGKPVGPYKRKDAARARGWAKRVRNGYGVDRSTGELTDGADHSQFEDSEWPADDKDSIPF